MTDGTPGVPVLKPFWRGALAWFNLVFLALFGLMTLYAAFLPAHSKFKLFESPLPLIVGACALISLLAFLSEAKVPGWASKLLRGKDILLVFMVLVGVQLLVAYALRSYGYTWDSNLILQQAMRYATTGGVDPTFTPYLANNPNNIGLLAGLGMFFRTLRHFGFTDLLTAAIALNVALMSAAQVLLYMTVKLMYGRRLAALALVFGFVFITLSMYVQIPYTDTLTIIFPISLLYMAYKAAAAPGYGKVGLSALIGVVAVLGYLIKPTVIIALIAIGVTAIFWFIAGIKGRGFRPRIAVAAACVLSCAGAAAGTYLGYQAAVDSLHIVPFSVAKSNDTSKPALYFFSMGLKTTRYDNATSYGGYNEADSTAVSSLLTKEEKSAFAARLAQERLGQYGILGYGAFLSHKANAVLSDATFYAYGEGSNQKVVFTSNDPVSRAIRAFMYIGGDWFVLFGNVLQVFWLALLILISGQLLVMIARQNARYDARETLPRLMLAGIIVFLLLFEARSRYLFLYVPIFIVVAMGTLQWFIKRPAPSKPVE